METQQSSFMRSLRCPSCGSFLDSPRTNPQTGRVARKCLSCLAWHERQTRPKAGRRPRLPSRRRALAVSTLAVLALAGCGSDSNSDTTTSTPAASSTSTTPTTAANAGKATTLKLKADPSGALRFNKKTLAAPSGKVTIEMSNASPVGHNIAIDGNGVEQKGAVVQGGGTSKVTADLKPGQYTFYCSVDGHEMAGMKGTLTVK